MIKKTLSYLYLNFAQATQFVELYQPTYNPNYIRYLKPNSHKRICDDRLHLISENINLKKIHSYLDIGSQLGYFVFKIAENSHIQATGIEQDRRAYYYAKSLEVLNQTPNTKFIYQYLTPQIARGLEKFDMISLLSVFHHLVTFQGFKAADQIVDALVKKCRYFVFETGQEDERNMQWSKNLTFMDRSPKHWLKEYLQSKGLKVIRHSLVPTHLSKVDRSFFICARNK